MQAAPETLGRTKALQRFWRDDNPPIPLLLFPAHDREEKLPVPENFLEQMDLYYIQNQTAGLYYMEGNEVNFLDGKTRNDAFQRSLLCPWSPTRGTNLAEMLRAFTDMIEKGYWSAGTEGVEGGLGWFNGDEGPNESGRTATSWTNRVFPLRKRVAGGTLIELQLAWGPDIEY